MNLKSISQKSFGKWTNTPCRIRLISNKVEFDALEEKWTALVDEANVSVFQSFEWLNTWWKYYAKSNYQLNILIFTSSEKTVGIAPLFREHCTLLGMKIATRLQFIGRSLSDYVDLIIQPGFENSVLTAFAQYLQSSKKEWDTFDIEDVNESSPLVKLFPKILEDCKFKIYRYQGNVCPYVTLPLSSDVLMQRLGPTSSYNFKRKYNKLQKNFKAEVKLIQNESDDIASSIETFSAIHGQRWKSLGFPSAFDDPHHRAFHVEFSQKAARRGWLRLFFLKVNEQAVAVSYSFNFKKRIFMYHSNVHASEEIMRNSPGFLIRSIAMVEGIREGMEIFDFLRGNEPYKYKEWKAVDSKNYLIRIPSKAIVGKIRYFLYIIYELLTKMSIRIRRELHEYARFKITKSPTLKMKISFTFSKISELCVLGYNFILRHIPARAIQNLQIKKKEEQLEKDIPENDRDESNKQQ